MASKFTTDYFIDRAKEIHNNKYDYSKVEYINTETKVIIICPTHGWFMQRPNDHLQNKGCKECANNSKSLSAQDFVEKSKVIHNNFYTYGNTNYVHSKSKISITCPIHGDFIQSPSHHLQGQGCPQCKGNKINHSAKFIKTANMVHDNKYNYLKLNYIDSHTKVTITCPVHGDFNQRPNSHLQGQGCKQCSLDVRKYTTSDFIFRSNAVHQYKYNYCKTNYINSATAVTINCLEHGDFKQVPADHIRGRGCPSCAKTGFDINKPAVLYYLKVNGGQAYKIGITNKTVEERFSKEEMKIIEILAIKDYVNGEKCYKAEQQVLEDYKEFKYNGVPLLVSGNTELFDKDVLELDTISNHNKYELQMQNNQQAKELL